MKKIAIITIIDGLNYGNKLQNYAVSHCLEKNNFKNDTIIFKVNDKHIFHIEEYRVVKNHFIIPIKALLKKNYEFNINQLREYKRRKNYNNFAKKNIKMNTKYRDIDNFSILKKLNNEYDYFVVGSDQIWNYDFGYDKPECFLYFADNNKKVCFSPSFGVSEIPDDRKADYTKWLKEIPMISVREDSGAKIVKELTGKDATVLIDPTLMLNKEEWLKVAKKPKVNTNKKYILKYFLGSQTDEQRAKITKIANDNGMVEYELLDMNNMKLYCAGPDEFIELINNASLVCTDSFHACVFSIIFNKPFLVFDRDGNGAGMGSRITTLLSKFKLERRLPNCVEDKDIFEHDYTEAYQILEVEREKVRKFLKESMDE